MSENALFVIPANHGSGSGTGAGISFSESFGNAWTPFQRGDDCYEGMIVSYCICLLPTLLTYYGPREI